MPEPGDVIENPVTGERIEFRTAPTGRHRSLHFDYYLEPGGFGLGKLSHVHPIQEEGFDLQSGTLGVRVGGDEWEATPGTRFAVPCETPHTVWNAGSDEVHAHVEIKPALSIGTFFETMYGLARDGKTNAWGLPGPLQLAVVADAFREELYLAGLPKRLQRGAVGLLASIGRQEGYRAVYPRYSDRTVRITEEV
ncbi:cupin domain-containing protein [Halomicrobium salinisoli]|uniref:cupin domain-containing protein n=1 Tax=Halomicrobium salinisoli TaxID=2878391 RepID=UPI001CEFDAFF|nr:cupin domain-containing protein [Halomicrobium salinisoli]